MDRLCQAALECQDQYTDPIQTDSCPIVFDGWSCVAETSAGQNATFACPDFSHLNFSPNSKCFYVSYDLRSADIWFIHFLWSDTAYRTCSDNGTWWDEERGRPYSHYEACLDTGEFQWNNFISKTYIAGYSISLLFLIPAFATLLYFRFVMICFGFYCPVLQI